jgi:hypothetical protein
MFGGIAVAKNLLCIAHGHVHGKVFLVDLDERRLVSFWQFHGPEGKYADAGGIAVDGSFKVYVADTTNGVVRRFTAFGKELNQYGKSTDRGPGAAGRDQAAVLDRPTGIAVHDGVLFVTCGDRKLVHGVQRFALEGTSLPPLRSCGEEGRRFGAPRGIWAGAAGIYVADTLSGAVQRFTIAGRFVDLVPTSASEDEASRPVAVLPLAGGGCLVCDAGDREGLALVKPGRDVRRLRDLADHIEGPTALARDEQGRFYVLDRLGERVHRLGPELDYETEVVDLAELIYGD